jgi:hypothetical protein
MLIKRLFRASAVALALVVGTATIAAASPTNGLHRLRAATTKYHSIKTAEHHGYAKFSDINGISCIAMPGMGAMGVHYVNSTLVGDPAIVPTTPEAMVYAPDSTGKLHLAAVEYIVVKSAWDATHKNPPMLFGHMFMTTRSPNRYGLPTFYSLHVWIYKHNPAGKFRMWNPTVHCPVM